MGPDVPPPEGRVCGTPRLTSRICGREALDARSGCNRPPSMRPVTPLRAILKTPDRNSTGHSQDAPRCMHAEVKLVWNAGQAETPISAARAYLEGLALPPKRAPKRRGALIIFDLKSLSRADSRVVLVAP